MHAPKKFRPKNLPCLFPGCPEYFVNSSGHTQHSYIHTPFCRAFQAQAEPNIPGSPGRCASPVAGRGDAGRGHDGSGIDPILQQQTEYHQLLNGRPCDREGNFLLPNTPPLPKDHPPPNGYSPYHDHLDFHLADLLYHKIQMSAGAINELMQNWAAHPESVGDPPFADREDLYHTIDAMEIGHIPSESFEVTYDRPIPPGNTTPWKTKAYTVHFRDPRKVVQNQLANPDFKLEMDFTPKRVFKADGSREYQDFIALIQDVIVEDPATHGSTFVPIILGSDKTTVSVATSQNNYYLLYMSNGLVYNNVQCAHHNAVTLIGFLAIPKTNRENQDSAEFRTFHRNLFHRSLRHILESLKPAMTVLEATLFADGHYRRVIYGLSPYIADHSEEVLLACTVQGWCARCTASNKDLDGSSRHRSQAHTEALFEAFDHKMLWDDYGVIPDVPPFTWTFLWADIHELLGTFKEVIHMKSEAKKIMADIDRRIAAVPPFPGLHRFPEGRDTLIAIDVALAHYHLERKIFEESGSKHIKAMKEPWQRSSWYEALYQMLTINDCLNKLAATRIDFTEWGMLSVPAAQAASPVPSAALPPPPNDDDNDVDGTDEWDILGEVKLAKSPIRHYPHTPHLLAEHLHLPSLPNIIRCFLYLQDHPDLDIPMDYVDLNDCPDAPCSVKVFPSHVAIFYAPSDQPSNGRLLRERIWAVHLWHSGPPCYDCVFVEKDTEQPGFHGLLAAHHHGLEYPCALVTWFSAIGNEPYPDVGMWMVEPDTNQRSHRAHLIPIFASKHSSSLDSFKAFYVNKYADHHSHEIAF
ncbi:hypothetical protein B0H10DRAFT_2160473 [Mycena sp. CBHHK59/15]|nr:hypothetical protein B0H10DRAFT_2160473 [Mycena sp. CBHHK59/15]